MKRVILIIGTPCTGKTTTAKQLATKLAADYINLTEYAKTNRLTIGEDKERQTTIINEEAMQQKLTETINTSKNANIIIDGHYAAAVTPKPLVTRIFVLRRNPIELRRLMEKRGFQGAKLWENLASEILDVCLTEALQKQKKEKVCELDITEKTVDANVNEILAILNKNKKCQVGQVDWLGMLETQGLLDKYLNF
jgi:adenylate kinase